MKESQEVLSYLRSQWQVELRNLLYEKSGIFGVGNWTDCSLKGEVDAGIDPTIRLLEKTKAIILS